MATNCPQQMASGEGDDAHQADDELGHERCWSGSAIFCGMHGHDDLVQFEQIACF